MTGMILPTDNNSFVICLDNTGYEASLELGKLCRFVPDEQAAGHGYIRVIDESGEDYAYASTRFAPIQLPEKVATTLLANKQYQLPLAA